MTTQMPSQIYHYSAHGHGFSAHVRRPFDHLIDVQAASSLPTIGGHGTSRVDNFRLKEFVSFKSAYSHVSGSRNPANGHYTTLVTATVEGLNVQDVVTADRLVARLAADHDPNAPRNDREPHIIMLGSKFENLQIAGCRVELELDHEFFLRLETFEECLKELDSNAQFRKIALDPLETGQAVEPPKASGVLLCSLVKEMRTACPGVTRHGHCFVVPQFGRIYLAEILARYGTRTLTMLRLELGSPVSNTAAAAEAIINGHTWP